jgi:predicted enzyme related to lactoylglutathione lyase
MTSPHPRHGGFGHLQLPATDPAASAAFYRAVLGWSVDDGSGGFEAPGIIGQLTNERAPAPDDGPLLWLTVDRLAAAIQAAVGAGGRVHRPPFLDGGRRWLAEIDDPAGNRIGLVGPVHTARPQVLLTVTDVAASSRWYQQVLGLTSDHGGPHYERLLADGDLVLQLHHLEVDHHHGPIRRPDVPVGNGVLVWFGEVTDFDGAVARAAGLDAPVVRAPHRNPPDGVGIGPGHRELWVEDPDGYVVVIASPDGEAYLP